MSAVPTCIFSNNQPPQVLHGHAIDLYVQIGSLSKALTGTVLAQLAAAGTVNLDAPLDEFLRVPPNTGITLRHLALHTSGLPRVPPGLRRRDPYMAFDEAAMQALPGRLGSLTTTEPGATEEYSNLGYAVLGATLVAAAGMPYQELLTRYVLAPLELTEVTTAPPPSKSLYSRGLFGRPRRPWTMTGPILPAGGLWATPRALARLVPALLVDRRLGDPALSWQRTGRLLWHNGATGDASVFTGALPDGSWVLVHRLNGQVSHTDELAIALLKQSALGPSSGQPSDGAQR
ncbi:serine hydrolase domain-containing protein [Streptomyces sp. NPDC091272]|uniref:serine hydrolase domain-containing protein n=1 Tax=Streptomyces sp. NPDC091272 TaxID=3365981 RepID=UPI00380215AF